MRPQIIFVDWDGTLSTSRFWGHWATDPHLAPHYASIQRVFFEASPENIENWMRGRLTAEMVARFLSTRTGIPPEIILAGLYRSSEQMTLIDPEVLSDVAELRKQGSKVVIATDNMDSFTRWTVPALQLQAHFDAVLNSHTLRALKRDVDHTGRSPFFSDYLEREHVSPSETLLIDNSVNNQAVTALGMGYIQVAPDQVRNVLRSLLDQ